RIRQAVSGLRLAVRDARRTLDGGAPVQEVTWRFQRDARIVAGALVSSDLANIRSELEEIPGIDLMGPDACVKNVLGNEAALEALSGRDASPLAAIEAVGTLLRTLDLDRDDEAQPVMPLSTI